MNTERNLKTLRQLRESRDLQVVRQRMKVFSGNVSAVARSLDVNRDTIYAILRKGRGNPS